MNHKYWKFKVEELIVVIDPLSPYDNQLGIIKQADNSKLRYIIEFEDGFKDGFWFHQIKPYRTEQELDALIDLSLALGEPAKWMFHEWLFEKKSRFQRDKG
jgi:hypothetical protein